jgi:hypothetical protein
MAMIYDMASGKVVSGNENSSEAFPREHMPATGPALRTIEAGTPIEDMPPVDAYMVMLQELLKKL